MIIIVMLITTITTTVVMIIIIIIIIIIIPLFANALKSVFKQHNVKMRHIKIM